MPDLGYDDNRGLFGLGQAPTDPFPKLEPAGNAARFLPSSLQGQYEEEDAARELRDQQIEQEYQAYVGNRGKKFIAESWEEAMSELQTIAGNVVTGYGTDLVDLGHMVGDVAAYGTGTFNEQTDDFWDDRDNPLTRWRRNKFQTTTEVGQFANTTLRFLSLFVGAGFAAKGGSFLLRGGARAATRAPVIGRGVGKAIAATDKATEAIRAYGKVKPFSAADVIKAEGLTGRAVSVAKKLQDAPAYMRYDSARILNAVKQNPSAYKGLRAVSTAMADNLKAFTAASLPTKIRTVGDLVVKDAFVTFMMAEDPGMEGTIGDWAAESGNDFLLSLSGWSRTDALDSALQAKLKIVANDVLWSIPIQGMVEAARLANLAKLFKKVGPEAQQRIYRNLNAANYPNYLDSQLRTPLVADPFTADVPTAATGLPTGLPSGGPPTASLQALAPELLQLDSLVGQARRTADARLRVQQTRASYNLFQRELSPITVLAEQAQREQPLLTGSTPTPPAMLPGAPSPSLLPGSSPALLPPKAVSISVPPIEIRAAVTEALKRYGASEQIFAGQFGEFKAFLESTVADLIPRSRAGMAEYFSRYDPQVLVDKTINVVDNIWHSFIGSTGLDEGWVKVDDKFNYVIDAAAAMRKDADIALKGQAEEVDRQLRMTFGVPDAGRVPDEAAPLTPPVTADSVDAPGGSRMTFGQEPPAAPTPEPQSAPAPGGSRMTFGQRQRGEVPEEALPLGPTEEVLPSEMFREAQLRTGTAAQPPASMADEALMGAEPTAEVIRRDPAPTRDTLQKAQEVVKALPVERTGDLRIDVTNFQLRLKNWEKALGLKPGDLLDPSTTEIGVADALNLAEALEDFALTARGPQREPLARAATQLRERVAAVSGEVNDLANVGRMADDIDAIDQNGLQCDA